MKRIQSYNDFLIESSLNEGIMAVGPIKIDTTEADKFVDEKINSMATPEAKKNFKNTTGLDIEGPLREVAVFLKDQLKYINPVLYKKDLTQAEFDKMTTDLVARVDAFIKTKTEELLKKMSFKAKAALSVIPEVTLKKMIQKQNNLDTTGVIENIIKFLGDIPGSQTFDGPKPNPKFPDEVDNGSKPVRIKTTPSEKNPYSSGGSTKDRSDLFWNWATDNAFGGKNLVNHYIDLVVPILA